MIYLTILTVAVAVPVYSYFVFPVALYVLARFCDRRIKVNAKHQPSVTLLISAYNEARVIDKKLENTIALHYPNEKMQIVVANDGSFDGTDEIVDSFSSKGVVHHRVEGRGGKNAGINKTWHLLTGEIVVFSDANALYEKDAISRLVAHFADERVGCVCGELRYIDAETGTARGEDLYWKYEQFLKRLESRLGQVLVLNGSIFAIRRNLFRQLHPRIANDFQVAVDVASQGYAIVYEPEAVAKERAAGSAKDEFNRKTRIIARGFQGVWQYLRMFKGMRLFLLLSHKVLRWYVWLAMLAALTANALLLDHTVFRWLFAGQLLFYTMALVGPYLIPLKIKLLAIPYYFFMVNLAALVGFWKFLTGAQRASWEPPSSAR